MSKASDNKHDRQHLRNLSTYQLRIDRIFQDIIREAARLGASVGEIKPDTAFSFDDYPTIRKRVEKLMSGLKSRLTVSIVNGIDAEWTLANNKNSELARRVFGDKADKLTEAQQRRYFSTNDSARQAFQQRRVNGLNLSERVWRYADQFKNEIEMGLDLGIRSGLSADEISRDLRQYLRRPDMLFRRVRDEHGQLHLSKRAADYHPGRGVYRSSYMNARRLAATEANIAYRTSDHLRWQQMDFVVGIEIRLSNNHTCKGSDGKPRPFIDICDKLQGRYPKDFKFTGWHPHCRCYAISILKTQEEIAEDTKRILNGESTSPYESVNFVGDVPPEFKEWIGDNKDRILYGKSIPYFLSDNPAYAVDAMPVSQQPELWDRLTTPKISQPSLPTPTEVRTYTPFAMTLDKLKEMIDKRVIRDNINMAQWEQSPINGLNPDKMLSAIEQKANSIGSNVTRIRIDIPSQGNLARIRMEGDGWECSRGFKRGEDGVLTVEHRLFEVDKDYQGKGLSKAVLRAFYEEYRAVGVDKITVHANIDVGGYTWARYGFQADSRNDVKYAVNWSELNPTQSKHIQQMIDDWYATRPEDSPFPIKKIADLTYGRTALLGRDWFGTIDLRDSAQREVFEKYLGI